MSGASIEITPEDLRLVRALASLAEHQPGSKRAEHLAIGADVLARRMAAALEETDKRERENV